MAGSSVSSVTTNFFPRANEGFTTTVGGSGVTSGGSTVPLTSVSGLVDGSVFVGIIEPGLTNEQTFTGVVDVPGVQITGVNWTRGTNTSHAAGKTVVDYVTGTYINLIQKGLLVSHNQDGTIKATAYAKRNTTTATSSTPTPNADTTDIYVITALAANATFGAPTGTPVQGQSLVVRIKDNGTARTLTWNSAYRAIGAGLPLTTVISKTMYLGFMYNSTDSKWDLLSISQEL